MNSLVILVISNLDGQFSLYWLSQWASGTTCSRNRVVTSQVADVIFLVSPSVPKSGGNRELYAVLWDLLNTLEWPDGERFRFPKSPILNVFKASKLGRNWCLLVSLPSPPHLCVFLKFYFLIIIRQSHLCSKMLDVIRSAFNYNVQQFRRKTLNRCKSFSLFHLISKLSVDMSFFVIAYSFLMCFCIFVDVSL